jgi:hypothetical protein
MSPANGYRWQISSLPYELERNLNVDPQEFADPAEFRQAMIRAERCVARVESPEGTALGTGFLVSPDLLLTNDHVRAAGRGFDSDPAAVRFRFGCVDGGRVTSRCYGLVSAEWRVAASPVDDLDFCLVRLAEPAGDHTIGHGLDAPVRGWVTPHAGVVTEKQSLAILQHPLGEVLKLANGYLSNAASDWIEYHVNTEPGSSGSPVFDSLWRCVALHSRAGRVGNRGVALFAVLGRLPAAVREELIPCPLPTDATDLEGARTAGSSVAVDVTVLTAHELQSVGGVLLTVGSAPTMSVRFGAGRALTIIPGDFARDPLQRVALKGCLDVYRIQLAALQEQEQKRAIDPAGVTARGVLIAMKTEDLLRTVDEIRDRVGLMADELRITR